MGITGMLVTNLKINGCETLRTDEGYCTRRPNYLAVTI